MSLALESEVESELSAAFADADLAADAEATSRVLVAARGDAIIH